MKTLGDHLQRRRLDLGLLWKDVATQIGTHNASLTSWKRGATPPSLRSWSRIVLFLGYDPRPWTETLTDQLRRHRKAHGWSRAEAAARLGVNQSVVWRWESGQRKPQGRYLAKVYAFLDDDPRPTPVTIGEQLKDHRERLGVTLLAMASRLRVVQSTLCRWEAG